jgi:folate-dependent phosphoribosylglycinamide formyltransferase PurN
MIPNNLNYDEINISNEDNQKIVIFTGSKIRHKRFANRIINKFPNEAIYWFEINKKKSQKKTKKKIKEYFNYLISNPKIFFIKLINRMFGLFFKDKPQDFDKIEHDFYSYEKKINSFENDVNFLKIETPNSDQVYKILEKEKPLLIITLGGAKYSRRLINYAKISLNQHDGWCPEYRGSNTVDWTLFHRDYFKIGNTVHLLSDNIDAGHIIRRSTINLSVNDTPYICFLKSISLGTELIIETIENLFNEKKIKIFKQSEKNQKTFYRKNYTKNVVEAINRDFSNDLYKNTLIKMRNF